MIETDFAIMNFQTTKSNSNPRSDKHRNKYQTQNFRLKYVFDH